MVDSGHDTKITLKHYLQIPDTDDYASIPFIDLREPLKYH